MTKKALFERIEKLEEVVGSEESIQSYSFATGCWTPEQKNVGWIVRNMQKEINTLQETQNLLLQYLKVSVKNIPGTPERKEIQKDDDLTMGGIMLSSMDRLCYSDELSTPPQKKKPTKATKKPLRK